MLVRKLSGGVAVILYKRGTAPTNLRFEPSIGALLLTAAQK
jgi:hypothetical protein